jgi:hypothetical protein
MASFEVLVGLARWAWPPVSPASCPKQNRNRNLPPHPTQVFYELPPGVEAVPRSRQRAAGDGGGEAEASTGADERDEP